MHVVERAEAIGRDANAPWAWHRGVTVELGKRKFELSVYRLSFYKSSVFIGDWLRSGVLFSSKIEGIISG